MIALYILVGIVVLVAAGWGLRAVGRTTGNVVFRDMDLSTAFGYALGAVAIGLMGLTGPLPTTTPRRTGSMRSTKGKRPTASSSAREPSTLTAFSQRLLTTTGPARRSTAAM